MAGSIETGEAKKLSLIKKARRGNQDAFTELFRLEERGLWYFCLKMVGDETDAEDALQETCISIWKSLGFLKEPAAFRAWMMQIARRECIRILDKRITHREKETSLEALEEDYMEFSEYAEPDRELIPEAYVVDRERNDRLAAWISELPVKRREAILLYYYNGLSTTEIAKITGTTPNSVTGTLAKARKYLADRIEAYERREPS